MKIINPNPEQKNKGHYVPGIISHGMLYVSGQLPIDSKTGAVAEGGIAVQTQVALQKFSINLTLWKRK